MPLYDLVMMIKSRVDQREIVDIMKIAAERVFAGNGIVLGVRSFGRLPLAYDIKKRDGWHKEAHMMQLTVMAPPSLNKDLEFMNKDERILRRMVLKDRGTNWMKSAHFRE